MMDMAPPQYNENTFAQSKRKLANTSLKGGQQQTSPSPIVPTLTNVDEIFHLLSQKIAKYCQILADLTNCEVFYKVN